MIPAFIPAAESGIPGLSRVQNETFCEDALAYGHSQLLLRKQ